MAKGRQTVKERAVLQRAVKARKSYKVWSSLAINNSIKNLALSFELMNCADFKC